MHCRIAGRNSGLETVQMEIVMERTAAPSQDSGFASIMVPINLGAGAADRVRLAVSLAERFGSRLIGIAAQELDRKSVV